MNETSLRDLCFKHKNKCLIIKNTENIHFRGYLFYVFFPMRGSKNFFRGTWPDGQKKRSGQRCFILVLNYLFYSLQMGGMVLLQRKLYFSKDPEWVEYFPGWGRLLLFFRRGVQMLISIETHITCDFPGGGGSGPPIPPLDPHLFPVN